MICIQYVVVTEDFDVFKFDRLAGNYIPFFTRGDTSNFVYN